MSHATKKRIGLELKVTLETYKVFTLANPSQAPSKINSCANPQNPWDLCSELYIAERCTAQGWVHSPSTLPPRFVSVRPFRLTRDPRLYMPCREGSRGTTGTTSRSRQVKTLGPCLAIQFSAIGHVPQWVLRLSYDTMVFYIICITASDQQQPHVMTSIVNGSVKPQINSSRRNLTSCIVAILR